MLYVSDTEVIFNRLFTVNRDQFLTRKITEVLDILPRWNLVPVPKSWVDEGG
jgi:hypothetical protein